MQRVVKTYDLIPDGVHIIVEWDRMAVGTSIFVPCINTTKAVQDIKRITAERGWDIELRVCFEKGLQGVRVWRNL